MLAELVGREMEEKAITILENKGFLVPKEKVRRIMSYDIVANKNDTKFYIEVKGRKTGKNTNVFCISKVKIRKLIEMDNQNILFLFINPNGFNLCKLDDILNKKLLKINGQKIYVSFNK